MTDEIDYESEYKKVLAERDSYADQLGKYVDENNKLKADLKVQQEINRRTIGASNNPPVPTSGVSLDDALAKHRSTIKRI